MISIHLDKATDNIQLNSDNITDLIAFVIKRADTFRPLIRILLKIHSKRFAIYYTSTVKSDHCNNGHSTPKRTVIQIKVVPMIQREKERTIEYDASLIF